MRFGPFMVEACGRGICVATGECDLRTAEDRFSPDGW
jgi:hypothetical protein